MSFQPSSGGFAPSEHSFGDAGAPSAPGSNQAAHAAAAYWLGRAAGLTSSYTEKAKLLGYATKASAEAALLDAVPGGKLAYGSEVAILADAAARASSVPSAMSALLVLQGGVLEARKAAQRANPVYQGERAASYLPWVLGGGLLLGAAALLRPRGRANPVAAPGGWIQLFARDVRGSLQDGRDAIADVRGIRSRQDFGRAASRGVRRTARRLTHADTARDALRLAGISSFEDLVK